jgi:hypothetical protein
VWVDPRAGLGDIEKDNSGLDWHSISGSSVTKSIACHYTYKITAALKLGNFHSKIKLIIVHRLFDSTASVV